MPRAEERLIQTDPLCSVRGWQSLLDSNNRSHSVNSSAGACKCCSWWTGPEAETFKGRLIAQQSSDFSWLIYYYWKHKKDKKETMFHKTQQVAAASSWSPYDESWMASNGKVTNTLCWLMLTGFPPFYVITFHSVAQPKSLYNIKKKF